MNFFKKYYETIKSLAIIIGSVCYLHHYMDEKFSSIEARFDTIEGRLTRLETILIFHGVMYPKTQMVYVD